MTTTTPTPATGDAVQQWLPAKDAPEGVVVLTKIDDVDGCRNEQRLKRRGNLWWLADGSMYVYYTPTHYTPPSAQGGSE